MGFLGRVKQALTKAGTAIKNAIIPPKPIPPPKVKPNDSWKKAPGPRGIKPKVSPDELGRIRQQESGNAIKQKLINFGEKYKIDSKMLQKIKQMNPLILETMYRASVLLFEAYWDYDTLEKGPYGLIAGDTKNSEVLEFVQSYEAKIGKEILV